MATLCANNDETPYPCYISVEGRECNPITKPFNIPKGLVWKARKQVHVDSSNFGLRTAAVGGERFNVQHGGGGIGDHYIVLHPQAISSMDLKIRSFARLPHFRSGYWWCRAPGL